MSDFDFESYLSQRQLAIVPCRSKVQRLSDGYTNNTVRATFPKPTSFQINDTRFTVAKSLILKHAPPYVATDSSTPLSVERQTTEAKALSLFSDGLSLEREDEITPQRFPRVKETLHRYPMIQVPAILHHDKTENVLWISDLGEELKPISRLFQQDGLEEPQVEKILELAQDLGAFLKEFYATTDELPPSVLMQIERTSKAHSDAIWSSAASMTKGILELAGIENAEELAEVIKQDFEDTRNPPPIDSGSCLGMVDFWPGSVLVGPDAAICGLVDWEYFGKSNKASELGMFVAHIHITGISPNTSKHAKRHLKCFVRAMLEGYNREGDQASGQVSETSLPCFNPRSQSKFLTAYGREMVNGTEMYKADLDDSTTKKVLDVGVGALNKVKNGKCQKSSSPLDKGKQQWLEDLLHVI